MDIEKLTTLMSFIDVVQTKEFILGLGKFISLKKS